MAADSREKELFGKINNTEKNKESITSLVTEVTEDLALEQEILEIK